MSLAVSSSTLLGHRRLRGSFTWIENLPTHSTSMSMLSPSSIGPRPWSLVPIIRISPGRRRTVSEGKQEPPRIPGLDVAGVVAAIAAVSDREFNLHASSTSTIGVTTMVLVSGSYADEIGMISGALLMGNGNRANATIGRAVNLVKTNFYGSVPKDMDKSTFVHPGKYSICFAENLVVSPWPSLAASKGFGDDASTVTILAANAPLQVRAYGDEKPETFLTAPALEFL